VDRCSGGLLEQAGILEMGEGDSFYVDWKGTGKVIVLEVRCELLKKLSIFVKLVQEGTNLIFLWQLKVMTSKLFQKNYPNGTGSSYCARSHPSTSAFILLLFRWTSCKININWRTRKKSAGRK
jgi:hypothetical protein